MRTEHRLIIEQQFKLETYGMKEDSETYKKAYPESFKRYFFRLIKTLSSKKAGSMKNAQVYKNSRVLPTTFMVGGAPDPRRTFNKKIVMTA